MLEAADPVAAFKQPDHLEVAQVPGRQQRQSHQRDGGAFDSFRNFEANSRVARAFDDSAARTIDLVLRNV
ncbi:hypothetical protein HS125_00430 [bacterium]|nr:hypothetical protein [bacterium]